MTSLDNNEDKVFSLLKDDIGGSHVGLYARLHNSGFCNHGVKILKKQVFKQGIS